MPVYRSPHPKASRVPTSACHLPVTPAGAVSPAGNPDGIAQRLGGRQTVRRDDVRQSLAFDVFHRNENPAITFANVINRDDIWMIQPSEGLRFLNEPRPPVCIACQARRQNLERHLPCQPLVACAIDFAHSAYAERRLDFVWTEFCPGRESHLAAYYSPAL